MEESVRVTALEPAVQAGFVRLEKEEFAPKAFGLDDVLIIILPGSAGICSQTRTNADREKLIVELCNLWPE